MPNMEAQTVAHIFVNQFVCRFGSPQYDISIQIRAVISSLVYSSKPVSS